MDKIFKPRCSSLHKLMTTHKDKGEVLSETAKSYIRECVIADHFGYKKDVWSKYTQKGLECEALAISTLSALTFKSMTKNENTLENEWIKGTPDVNSDDEKEIGFISTGKDFIRDTKCPWDINSFPWFSGDAAKKSTKHGYDWQMQGYMWLADKSVAYVDFILLPTPVHLLAFGDDEEAHTTLIESIPIEQRHKSIQIKRDDEKIKLLKERIANARMYYDQLIIELKND